MDTTSPSAQGVDASAIAAFVEAIEDDPRIEPHGLIIQRHGRRIAEGDWTPHTGDRSRLVYSLSKTFTGTALGLLLGEGKLSLDDLVSDHLPTLFDGVDERTRRMRIRHIASMSTGHDRETYLEALAIDRADPVRGFLQIPPDAEPGTLFAYNQPPVIALATILQNLAGERLSTYLRPRVLDPIGVGELRWAQLRPGIEMGFSGVYTNLDAVARLGQLYLDDGMCDGRRLLPAGWVADASSVHIPNPQRDEPDWQQGYGFQLWMSQHGYRGDGAFGQYMVVLPEQDAVVAMFSCTEQMQAVLDLMWEHLLPAFDAAPASGAAAADTALAQRLAGLTLRTAGDGLAAGPPEVAPMTFRPAEGEPLTHRTITSIDTADGRMVIHEGDDALVVPLNSGWTVAEPLAATAARLDDGPLVVEVAFLASPHRLEIELDPSAGTFTTRWPNIPLFGAGLDNRLGRLRVPDA
jgi:CubicO group peptidase (beta-lactamase class C family)